MSKLTIEVLIPCRTIEEAEKACENVWGGELYWLCGKAYPSDAKNPCLITKIGTRAKLLAAKEQLEVEVGQRRLLYDKAIADKEQLERDKAELERFKQGVIDAFEMNLPDIASDDYDMAVLDMAEEILDRTGFVIAKQTTKGEV